MKQLKLVSKYASRFADEKFVNVAKETDRTVVLTIKSAFLFEGDN